MSVNFNSTYFQSFVDFAQRRVDANDAKAVISATVTQPLGGRKILAIDQSKTDSVHKWTRGFDEWKVNDDTRRLFKQSVALLFGGETKIPESVKKAMLLEDYNQGKPLTARRILAVNEAIKPFIEHFNEKLAEAKSAADTAYDKVNENDEDRAPDARFVTKAQVDGLVETAMKAVGEDRDALDVLARGNVMNGLLIRGDGALRSSADVAKKAKAILRNLDELRRAANGNPSVLAAGKIFLAQLNGKSVPDGMIAAMVRDALAADVSALKRLSASSSVRSIHKALNQFVATQVRIAEVSGAHEAMEGPDEKVAARDFVGLLLLAKCGVSGIRKIQAAMHSENAQKLCAIYSLIVNKNIDKEGLSSAAVEQTAIMAVRWRTNLGQLKIAADALMGLPDDQLDAVDDFKDEFDYEEFGAGRIAEDIVEAGKAEARRVHDEFVQKVVDGKSEGADALRQVYGHRIGPEAYEPTEKINGSSRRNASAMLNWNIASECRKIAKGDWAKTIFAKDLKRMAGSLKLGDVVLSDDFKTARDQIASFVTKGAKTTYDALSKVEKGKAHVVMGLLSQETGKAAFDGQLQSLDPKNARPPVVTTSDQEADTREIKLTIGDDGSLTMQFHGVQHLQAIMTDPGSGKPVTTFVGAGSTIDAHLDLKIHGEEFNRLASLDYTKFDDTRANEIMADKNAENKLPEAEKSFAKEFRFADLSTGLRVGLKATIN